MSEAKVRLIKMVRSVDAANGGPTQADVHPDEVEHYRAAGFSFRDGEPAAPKNTEKE